MPPRQFHRKKFRARRSLEGDAILLIDGTWTTGAGAKSAVAALKTAGAGAVAVVVIRRHLNREWHENDRRLRDLSRPFDWTRRELCDPARKPAPSSD